MGIQPSLVHRTHVLWAFPLLSNGFVHRRPLRGLLQTGVSAQGRGLVGRLPGEVGI